MDSEQLDALKQRICQAAEEELLGRFNQVAAHTKADGSIVTVADHAMQKRLHAELTALLPQYGLLGEEMSKADQMAQIEHTGAGLWVVDPLDGTSNYAAGIPYFATSLALLVAGTVALGIVYDPVRREFFHTVAGQGAWLNGRALGSDAPTTPLHRGIGLVDYKRLPKPLAHRLVESPPYSSQRSLGSVALDFCWLAAGRGHVYLHGRHDLWDYAAGMLILHEAGGQTITLEGERTPPLDLAPRSTAAALRGDVFDQWCRWLEIES